MWRSTSIFFQISLLFACALISFLAVAFFYGKIQPSLESIRQYNTIVSAISKMRQFNASLNDIRWFLEEENFHELDLTEEEKARFISNTQIPKIGGFNISVIQEDDNIFIALRTQKDFIIYQDPIIFSWSKYSAITILGATILVVIYIMLMKRLIPLNHIKSEIINMTRDNVFRKITHGENNQDEIGEVVREFNRSIAKINAVDESRMLFLRSIMHELKTPITKGRIVAEMVTNDKQKQRLCSVFERLNTLINEFAKIEQLASKNYNVQKTEILVTDMINEVMNMLLIDQNNQNIITLNHHNDLIKADFDLFALSIKNLVDNAIKYSEDSKVIIETNRNDISIKNKGEPLKLNINEYFKPYFKDIKNPLSQGFGLGMYIIKSTLEAQNFDLSYKYENGYNTFIIHNCIIENFCILQKNDTHTIKNKN
ncbi:sensor histidine kinase [Helicobacter didelphidarum]|uniref:histidine kinase n=1 Tax=Helicobacter didelphidarum TaxID=2040648 RepID=A0A3D8IN98_9HELI|nr:ArsS family sensor histidine kinase [Helicobacter didelphidarum]RDU66376.1 sensor histidine kinase [Helicobacter didelphidarum]